MSVVEEEMRPRKRRKIRDLDEEQRRRHKRDLSRVVGRSGMWPLNAPGMPMPGPSFINAAKALGDDTIVEKKGKIVTYSPGAQLKELYRRALREPGFTLEVESSGVSTEPVTFIPGHLWGENVDEWGQAIANGTDDITVTGPQPAEVMVIGKMPWKEEMMERRNLVGMSGQILKDLVERMHIRKARKWYVTNLCKFMPPGEKRELRSAWIKDCLPLLHQELRIVRPKYILCLGAEASKKLLGKEYTVSYMAGRVIPFTFDLRVSPEQEPDLHTSYVMTVLHPVNVISDPAQARILESNFGRFANLLSSTAAVPDFEEKGLDHRTCYTLEDALEWIEEATFTLMQQPEKLRLTGWDLEWQGAHPVNEGSYVRTIQCSWAEKSSITFVLHHPGGDVAFRDRAGKKAVNRLITALNEFVKLTRPVGHFLVADLEWAEHIGLDLVSHCKIPLYDSGDKKAWQLLMDGQGWLDTAMMNHAIEETAPLGLEMLTMRYTMAPRYDIALEDWKDEYCKKRGIKKAGLEGYGDCPDHILVPYANYDADVTRRIAMTLLPLLDCDYEGNNCWEALWESMIVQKPILRIHQHGIKVDRARIDDLTVKFITWRAAKEEEVRVWAKWNGEPPFNIRSVQQVKEFLFGEHLNGKRDKLTGQCIRIRPPDAKSLYLEPLLDTSKPPKQWRDLVAKNLHHDASPGTNKVVLGILARENLHSADQINMIRDYRFLDQVLKSVLRVPKKDDDDYYIEGDDGFLEYDAGLAYVIDDDGRVRPHMYPTAETARWKCSRPNLQNLSKSRDADYRRLLGGKEDPATGNYVGGDYTHTLRSVLRASKGYALVEADYKGAELYGMALMSGSRLMQKHCQRSLLPEKGYDKDGNKVDGGKCAHPDYYDIHSNVAVLAFKLTCVPTKAGLEGIGKGRFRTLAKNVIFGIAYGRQAKAIALQAKEQGIDVTPDQAQQVIDAIFRMYPELEPFFEEAKNRAKSEGWLCNCFGRFRRFPKTDDSRIEGEFERQAMNFPIQSMIASCVDRGIAFLVDKIEELGLQNEIRILLQIHDAILLEAKYEYVGFAKQLIHWAFVDMVEIWPTNLAGTPRGDGPYHLGLEFEVSERHWGEKIKPERAAELGIAL